MAPTCVWRAVSGLPASSRSCSASIDGVLARNGSFRGDLERAAVGQTDMRIGPRGPAQIENFTHDVALDLHPLIRVVGVEVGFAADDHRPVEERRADSVGQALGLTSCLLPGFEHLAPLGVQRIEPLTRQKGPKIPYQCWRHGDGCRANRERTRYHGHIEGAGSTSRFEPFNNVDTSAEKTVSALNRTRSGDAS